MSLLARLSLSLGAILAAIVAALWFSQRSSESQIQSLREDRREERARFFDRALQLQGVGLASLTAAYSWWDDMVGFVADPDPAWASDNIDTVIGMPNGADALWVLNRDHAIVHRIDANYGRPHAPFATIDRLRTFIGQRYEFSYFARIDGQLWQIFGAAIQDPNFWRHETPVQGYLLLGKRCDETWLALLGNLAGAELRILPLEPDESLGPRQFSRVVHGLQREPVARIVGSFDTSQIDDAGTALRRHLTVMMAGVIAVLMLGAGVVALMIVRPLDQIVRSLEARNPLPLAELLTSRTRFGEIARLLASHFRQGRMLQDEIRRRLEAADPRIQEREHESNENLRMRIASDLHDGPLQSIYAAGLKLAALEQRLTTGRAIAPAELEAIRTILSECTTNLRNLLFNLEPEELRDQDLENALERLEKYMKSFSGSFRLTIANHAFDGIGRDPQVDVYYICRELVNNAARHSRPQQATLSFKRREGFLLIEWTNDGILAPDRPTHTGNGLRNIEQRVKRLDGSWTYRLHRGRTWIVTVEIPYTSLVGPITLDTGSK